MTARLLILLWLSLLGSVVLTIGATVRYLRSARVDLDAWDKRLYACSFVTWWVAMVVAAVLVIQQ